MSSLQTGTVKFFLEGAGWGFAVPDEGGRDVFLHISGLAANGRDRIQWNKRVSFFLDDKAPKHRPRAKNWVLQE